VVEAVDRPRAGPEGDRRFRQPGLPDHPADSVCRRVDTPQFFPSSVSTIAASGNAAVSFVIAVASSEIVERVEQFHRRRHELGIYTEEPE
jgi:hypothetical protein